MKIRQIMKKAGALGLTAAMVMSFMACGNSQEQTGADANAEDSLKVGIIQMVENGAFNDMRQGFIDELAAKGYDEDKVEIVYKSAQGDATNLNTICQEMVTDGVDLVATIATPATQGMVNMESDIPVFFVAVSAPVQAGVITEMEHPDKNATGTSNAIPVSDIFALSEQLTPDCKTFGFLYNTSEVNSVNTVNDAKAYCDENGLKYVEAVVTNSSEVQQAAQTLSEQVDAIFVPNDSVIQSAMPNVAEVARDAKIPVYGSSAVMVTSGAFATIAVDDKAIGAKTADMAIEYLEGKAIEDIPAVVVGPDATVINQQTVDALGIELSDDVKNTAVFVEDTQ